MGTASVVAGSAGFSLLSLRQRLVFAALELFLGIGAVYGGVSLLVDAEAFGMKEAWLDGSPFPDYVIPGLFLLVAIGGGMLAAAALALAGSGWAAPAALVMGLVVLVFLAIETLVIGYQGATQLPLLVTTVLPAEVLVVLGARRLQLRHGL